MPTPTGYTTATVVFGGATLPFGGICTFSMANDTNLDPDEITGALISPLTALHQALAVEQCVIVELRVKNGPEDTGPYLSTGLSIPGDQGDDDITPQVCLNIRKNTLLGGPKGRGRMFWPGVSDLSFDPGGNLDLGAIEQFLEAVGDFKAALEGIDMPMVLLPTDPEDPPLLVNTLTVGPRSITLRKRNRPRF